MPLYILAIGLLAAWVAALLLGGSTMAIAGGVGATVIARRRRAGQRVPRGLQGTSITVIVLGMVMLIIGTAAVVFNVLVALDLIN